jgi:uncharacterized membrane protein required for colicin V production
MYIAFYLLVLFAATAMMVQQGLWSNAVSLICILISGLVAFGFYSPLAIFLDEMLDGSYTYLLDFVTIWGLFVITMLICRLFTGMASRTRMRFKNPIDPIGGPVLALLAAWALSGFVMATLHTSPMPKDAFGGALVYSDDDVESASSLFSPDLGWLRFVERVTRPDGFGHSNGNGAFSAKAFVKIYGEHRKQYQEAKPAWIVVRRG